MRRPVLAVLAATSATALLAMPASASPAPSRLGAEVPNCHAAQLRISWGPAQGAAGTSYRPLIFTNTGARCALWGVPAIQPLRRNASAAGPPARNESMGQMPVRHFLSRGQSASSAIGFTDTLNYAPATCGPVQVAATTVSLGGLVPATTIKLATVVCAKLSSVSTRLLAAGRQG